MNGTGGESLLWVVRDVMKNLMFFHYDKGSRAQKVVIELLPWLPGCCATDGYEAYSIYENKKGPILLVVGLMHEGSLRRTQRR